MPRKLPLADGPDPLEDGPSPETIATVEELIESVLASFTDRRRIVELILQGNSPGEIAAEIGTTRRTVHKTCLAAAKVLEGLLGEECG